MSTKYKAKKGVVVGIDVSKDWLDAWSAPKSDTARFAVSDLKPAVAWVRAQRPSLVVIEASGGYEAVIWAALEEAGLPVAVVNPLYVRRFAQSGGQFAKSDQIDAAILAEFGITKKPRVTPYYKNPLLRELLKRYAAIVEQDVAEQNRLQQSREEVVRAMIEQSRVFLETQRKSVEKAIAVELDKTETNRRRVEVLASTPGIGKWTARVLTITLPELGLLCRRKIAKLVGLAPFTRDSGKWKGKRFIGHGRSSVRAALYMPTIVAIQHNPVIRDYYKRLVAAGKPHLVAITACMRKLLTILNAMVRSNTVWAPAPTAQPQGSAPMSGSQSTPSAVR